MIILNQKYDLRLSSDWHSYRCELLRVCSIDEPTSVSDYSTQEEWS